MLWRLSAACAALSRSRHVHFACGGVIERPSLLPVQRGRFWFFDNVSRSWLPAAAPICVCVRACQTCCAYSCCTRIGIRSYPVIGRSPLQC